jgi:hypothetical protein
MSETGLSLTGIIFVASKAFMSANSFCKRRTRAFGIQVTLSTCPFSSTYANKNMFNLLHSIHKWLTPSYSAATLVRTKLVMINLFQIPKWSNTMCNKPWARRTCSSWRQSVWMCQASQQISLETRWSPCSGWLCQIWPTQDAGKPWLADLHLPPLQMKEW